MGKHDLNHTHTIMLLTQGGSGQVFDWTNLTIPQDESLHGWLLAGGLLPSNVGQAVNLASPTAVDVSSGVCGPDGESLYLPLCSHRSVWLIRVLAQHS